MYQILINESNINKRIMYESNSESNLNIRERFQWHCV